MEVTLVGSSSVLLKNNWLELRWEWYYLSQKMCSYSKIFTLSLLQLEYEKKKNMDMSILRNSTTSLTGSKCWNIVYGKNGRYYRKTMKKLLKKGCFWKRKRIRYRIWVVERNRLRSRKSSGIYNLFPSSRFYKHLCS